MARQRLSWVLAVAACMATSSAARAAVLEGVPEYFWYYGCAPTSAGMMVGYWDGLPGYETLFDGDASVESEATRDMITSPNHLGDPYVPYDHPVDCIADFMATRPEGLTDYPNVPSGLEAYIEWDNPATGANESYEAHVEVYEPWQLTWDVLTGEIDAGRPMMLNVLWWIGPEQENGKGHTVVAYGYEPDMFEISYFEGQQEVELLVGGYAVRDTWGEPDTTGGQWYDWDQNLIGPYLDENGVEWWPWLPMGVYYPPFPEIPDWFIFQAIGLDIEVPEPSTAALLTVPFVALLLKRLRRHAISNGG